MFGPRTFLASTVAMLALSTGFATTGRAATLNVSGGQLLGASGVLVDGNFYNVEFVDGTCIDLFNGCDQITDFTFQTGEAAGLAAQALLDQVLLDGTGGSFDSIPALTNGCESIERCHIETPWEYISPGWVRTATTYNQPGLGDSVFLAHLFDISAPVDTYEVTTWARWNPIPEPGTASLLALGLISFGFRRRR